MAEDVNQEMWEQCKALYKVVTYNGTVKAQMFRQSTAMANTTFRAQMQSGVILPWFDALANFIEYVENTLAARGETV